MRIKIVLCMIDFTGCYNEYVLLQISGTFDIKNMHRICVLMVWVPIVVLSLDSMDSLILVI